MKSELQSSGTGRTPATPSERHFVTASLSMLALCDTAPLVERRASHLPKEHLPEYHVQTKRET